MRRGIRFYRDCVLGIVLSARHHVLGIVLSSHHVLGIHVLGIMLLSQQENYLTLIKNREGEGYSYQQLVFP